MIALASNTPAAIVKAARCFISCVPVSQRMGLRTYLLTQLANLATPPYTAPTAPVAGGASSVSNTSISISWTQPSNSGSLIKNYIVYWGTAPGVYTSNSGSLPTMPRSYTITGLTAGTTYYWVVLSLASGGVPSAPSAEHSATTSGASPSNQLRQNLVSYWKFDVDSSPYSDSIGTNPLVGHGTNAAVAGIINNGLSLGSGASYADIASSNADFDPVNTSFSLSLWVSSSNWAAVGDPFYIVLNNGNPETGIATGPYYLYLDHALQQLICGMFDSGVNQSQLVVSAAFPTAGTFHHIVLSFDAAAKSFKAYYDGALAGSAATVTGGLYQGAGDTFMLGVGPTHVALPNYIIDELGMWHKALSAVDVSILYNGGAGLPLASFGS